MSLSTSTRETLLSIVDDMELICRELLENLIAPKPRRLNSKDHQELIELLIEKDSELKSTLMLAKEQGKIEQQIVRVQEDIKKKDACIRQLQKQFKDAEHLLSTSIYHAKQKLGAIEKAQSLPVSSEELIKYGHRISASNAVCAPLNWQQGDTRRPYPTDLEMRQGFLGRPDAGTSSHLPRPGMMHPLGHHSPADFPGTPYGGSAAGSGSGTPQQHSPTKMMSLPPQQQQQQFAWQGGEMGLMVRDGTHVPIEGRSQQQQQEDVEVMSTDSSSSSSTDSN